jgi:predicted O-methyltransferase YrrM
MKGKIRYSVSKEAIEWSKKKNPPLMDPPEVDLLIKYVKKCKIHFVEIGTHKGGSASLISKYLPSNVRLTTIDTFEKAPTGSVPPEEEPPTYDEARETIEKQGDISKVDIIKGCSWKVAEDWDRYIDVLFIDGDHRYVAVKKDFTCWEPYVVKGGYILMHDINLKGVKKAYRELLKSPIFSLQEKVGVLAVIKKLAETSNKVNRKRVYQTSRFEPCYQGLKTRSKQLRRRSDPSAM